ncbi:hypothetical protein MAP00_009014 [Monascus purpureus]|nr:hypothetical protein MAP00_009014 [Monascus purpureus]
MDSTAFLSNSPLPIAFLTPEDTGYPQLFPNTDDVSLHEPAVGNHDILVSGMNVFDDVVGSNMANINADFQTTSTTASSPRRYTRDLSGLGEEFCSTIPTPVRTLLEDHTIFHFAKSQKTNA